MRSLSRERTRADRTSKDIYWRRFGRHRVMLIVESA